MAKDDLNFCCGCHSWLAPDDGTIRKSTSCDIQGGVEIICDECLKLEQNAEVISHAEHDTKSGTLDEV